MPTPSDHTPRAFPQQEATEVLSQHRADGWQIEADWSEDKNPTPIDPDTARRYDELASDYPAEMFMTARDLWPLHDQDDVAHGIMQDLESRLPDPQIHRHGRRDVEAELTSADTNETRKHLGAINPLTRIQAWRDSRSAERGLREAEAHVRPRESERDQGMGF